MKACFYNQFGPPSVLQIGEIDPPKIADDEYLIAVRYAGVNPVDYKIRHGYFQGALPQQFPIVSGWDFAGVVAECGKKCKKFKVGDEVFGDLRPDTIQWGTYAEFCPAKEKALALKPKQISFAQAAGLCIPSLTAWQALFDTAKLSGKETIFITGGSGGVGSMAIQFAKMKGAKVITSARTVNHSYVKSLGADLAIDYTKENPVKKILSLFPNGIDLVFDLVGGTTLQQSALLVKKRGYLISIVDPQVAKMASKDLHAAFVFCEGRGGQLETIADLVVKGAVHPPEILELELKDAVKAHEMIEEGHTRGKIVLRVS